MRRQIMLVAVVLLATVSTAQADTIYNLVNYPSSQTVSGGTDTVSGTITTDGTPGPYADTSHLINASFVFTTPKGTTYTVSSAGFDLTGSSQISVTSTALLYYPAAGSDFELYGYSLEYPDDFVGLAWLRPSSPPTAAAMYEGYVVDTIANKYLAVFGDSSGKTSSGYVGSNDPWVIATPEPGTLTLAFSALLGLAGAVYLRRRRATV